MAASKPKAKKEDEGPPDVQAGDEIYFRHHQGPKSGRVVSSGKHGCLVDADGGRHKVRWEAVHGHKLRIDANYSVVDSGEDGCIVQDGTGRRRYLHDPDTTAKPGEGPIRKSYLPLVMLFGQGDELAKAIKNGPGLSLQAVTDKAGHQTKRWKKTSKDLPKDRKKAAPEAGGEHPHGAPSAKPGDTVSFDAGDFKGTGKVTAAGKDGAVVVDSSGREHNVHWNEIKGSERAAPENGGEGKKPPADKPSASGGSGDDGGDGRDKDGAEGIARALFNTSEIDKLPSKASQPVDSWEALKKEAPQALSEFKGMLDKVASELNLVTGKRPQSFDFAQQEENEKAKEKGREPKKLQADDYMLPEHWDSDQGFLFMGPLKDEERANEKVTADYGGDWSQLKDMVRATIAVPMVTEIPMVLRKLEAAGMKMAQKPKNNLVKPLPGGYRDINLIVRVPNGLLAELQIHIKPMTLAKEKGHDHYNVSRKIEAKYKKKNLEREPEKWDAADRDKHAKAMKAQEKIYGAAWEKATKPGSGKEPREG